MSDREEFLYPTMDTAKEIMAALALHPRDAGSLASAIERPAQVVWGVEAYIGLHTKAAALMDAVNRSHPLIDGNKRLSWLLVRRFYDMNGYDLVYEPQETDKFVRQVGGDHLSLEDVAAWLEARAVSR